ncbi:MAG: hypothetical protein JWO69_460 [Thermoleophilia bacterium]|nr:hypothetical protein [Thermoleophilia bacterium]
MSDAGRCRHFARSHGIPPSSIVPLHCRFATPGRGRYPSCPRTRPDEAMSLLRTIETRIARIVEGTFGKVFRTSVQPVELARKLVKEMDEHQQRTVRNVYVPNQFDVYLSRDDHRQLSQYASALTTELAEYLAEHARRNGYALLARPRVQLHLDRDLALGSFGIDVRMVQPSGDEAPLPADAPETEAAGHTMVYQAADLAPSPAAPASIGASAVFGPTGPFPLPAGGRVRVGRGRANEYVLDDPSVSREHAEFVHAGDGWLVRDLDSTNGVSVNGGKVREQPLEFGDTVTFGSADVRFDRWLDGEA